MVIIPCFLNMDIVIPTMCGSRKLKCGNILHILFKNLLRFKIQISKKVSNDKLQL